MKKISFIIITIILTLGLSFSLQSLLASWTAPTATPPLGNAPAPINQSAVGQQKLGGLILNIAGASSSTGLIVDKGRVGIGTSFPNYTLDVNGDARTIDLAVDHGLAIGGVDSGDQLSIGGVMGIAEGITSPTPHYGFGRIYSKLIQSNDKLLLHMDGSGALFSDSATSRVVTAGGAVTQTNSKYKFGTSSAYFEGTNSYVSVPASNDFNFGIGDFSIDFWVYPTDNSGRKNLIDAGDYSGWGLILNYGTDSKVYLVSPAGNVITTSSVVPLNAWTHIALTRQGGTLYMFLNGTLENSVVTGVQMNSNGTGISIGKINNSGTLFNWFKGYIDEVRITKGSARWTNTFIVPAAPASSRYSALFYMDGSGNETQLGAGANTQSATQNVNVVLIGGNHTADDCVAAGGTTFNVGDGTYICKMGSTACVGTWVRHQNWSETTANTCGNIHILGSSVVTTPFHYWSNSVVLQESVYYCTGTVKGDCSGYSYCYANIALQGCK